MKDEGCKHHNSICGFCRAVVFRCKCKPARAAVLVICDQCKIAERKRSDLPPLLTPAAGRG